jgi:hypothetical protein
MGANARAGENELTNRGGFSTIWIVLYAYLSR